MIKVLYLPLNSPEIMQTGMYDAWANAGVDLHVYDFYIKFTQKKPVNEIRKEFIETVAGLKPHLVHMQLQFTDVINLETLLEAKRRSPKSIFSNWTGDIRNNVPGEFVSVSNAVDYSLISSVGQINLYEAAGCKNIKYWQIGYNPKLYYPKCKTSFKYDISFTAGYFGNLFPDSGIRLEACRALQSAFKERFGLFGHGFPKDVKSHKAIPQHEVNDVYADSLCVLSISNFNDVSHYFSDRLLMCMASGRPTISYRFPGSESYFTQKSDLVIANTIDEIVNVVKYFKTNLQEANEIGINGHRRVQAEHTYTSRVFELLNMTGVYNS